MPALVLFGRNWRIGSDDFVFPGLMDLLVSVMWLIASVIVYWKNDVYMDCSGNANMRIYIYGVFGMLHLMIIFNAALVYQSKSGSIVDTDARRLVPLFVYLRLLLQTFVIAWNTLGTVWVFNGTLSCPMAPDVVNLVVGFIICNWVVVVLQVIGIFIIFDPFGSENLRTLSVENCVPEAAQEGVDFAQLRTNRRAKVWSRRIRRYALAPFTSSKSTIWASDEAGLLFGSSFMKTDLVPTDIAAGAILLGLRNRDANKEESALQDRLPPSEKTTIISQPTPLIPLLDLMTQDWRHPRLLSKFLVFAMASYNWPLVWFDSKPNSFGRLYKKAFVCGCIPGRKHPLNVAGDGCCFFRTAGVRYISTLAGIKDEDFIHLSFNNAVYENPFFVCKDDETKTIVISVRGTMSLDDVLTDFSGWPTPVDNEFPENFKAHYGMLTCAQRLKEKLEKLNIIPQVLDENPGYTPILTGTSLGAGVGAVLSLLLRKKFPNIKCYAFAPPGGLFTQELADYTNDFIQSVIYGNDFVSRLSIRNIEKLKYSIMEALKESKSPKYRILLGGMTMLAGKKPVANYCAPKSADSNKSKSSLLPGRTISTEEALEEAKNNNFDSMTTLATKDELSVGDEERLWLPCGDMYPPGRIIYITQTKEFSSGHSRKGYTGSSRWRMRWANRQEFDEVIINERMVLDHVPFRLQKALQVLNANHMQIGPLPTRAR